MATATTVKLDPNLRPVFAVRDLNLDAAASTSQLLQKNHDQHYIFFSEAGFHNHIAHHLPSIYALGASAVTLQKQYNANAGYQLPPKKVHENVVTNLHDPEIFKQSLSRNDRFNDFQHFFQDEIDKKGWQNVLNEYVFAGDERAEELFRRLFAGLLHPLIHLGFGIEFQQPALIAEALAETAVHADQFASYLIPAEAAANKLPASKSRPLMQLLDSIRQSDALVSHCITEADTDGSKLNMVIDRQGEEMVDIASRFKVTEENLEAKMKEMWEVNAFFTFTSQRPPHTQKLDFFLIHSLNACVFFPALLVAPWLSTSNKIRLLEHKARVDLANYVARACPRLDIGEVSGYAPKMKIEGVSEAEQWKSIFERACEREGEDGHLAKVVRSCAAGELAWKGGGASGVISRGMWLKCAHMAVDSTEEGSTWIRSAGLESSWRDVRGRREGVAAAL